jgi:hypothetical protein
MASRSVSDMGGSTLRTQFSIRLEMCRRRQATIADSSDCDSWRGDPVSGADVLSFIVVSKRPIVSRERRPCRRDSRWSILSPMD